MTRRNAAAIAVAALMTTGLAARASAQSKEPPQVKIPEAGVPQIMTIEGQYIRIAYNNEGYAVLGYRLANQTVGVTQVGERIWLVTFMQYDLGYFDDETCRLEPIANPFGPKVLPIRAE